MTQKHILLIFGGRSSEHEVSLMSARNIEASLDRQDYQVSLLFITKNGRWFMVDEVGESSDYNTPVHVDIGSGVFVVSGAPYRPDVVFPVLHGKYGEDGTLQGLLDLMNIPYVGCGVLSSALCMDKQTTKRIAQNIKGVKVARWQSFSDPDTFRLELADLVSSGIYESLGSGPWFVKPSRAGSSVGVSKVDNIAGLGPAASAAFKHDSVVMVEEGIAGREIEVAVLGSPPSHRASRLGEIIAGDSFYDYDEKYSLESTAKTSTDLDDLPEELKTTIQEQALLIYSTMSCSGLARLDFFLSESDEVYFNEVNTMPGFTDISMYPKLWQEDGVQQGELIKLLVDDALYRA